jgi:hypothetical protein
MALSEASEHALLGIVGAVNSKMMEQQSPVAKQQVLSKVLTYLRNTQGIYESSGGGGSGGISMPSYFGTVFGRGNVQVSGRAAFNGNASIDQYGDGVYSSSESVGVKRPRSDQNASRYLPPNDDFRSGGHWREMGGQPSLLVNPRLYAQRSLAAAPASEASWGTHAAAPRQAHQGFLGAHLNSPLSISHLLPPGYQLPAQSPSTFTGSVLNGALESLPLKALVEKLITPGRASDNTNEICAAILLHPDLPKKPSVLPLYSKMNGGLRTYSSGCAHAWLYTPRKRPSKTDETNVGYVSNSPALVFVYPDDATQSPGVDDEETAKMKNKLHFGGRGYPLSNNSVLLQHGAHKAFGCVAINH